MNVKKPVERNKESRLQTKFAVAAGVLAIVACGAAAELASAQTADPVPKASAVVLPEAGKPLGASAPVSESVTKTAKPAPVAKKPESQKRKTASQKRKTSAMQKSEARAKPAGNAKPVAKAKRAVKSKPALKSKHVATPVQVAQSDRKLAESTDQQVAPQPKDVLLEPAHPQVEPVTPAPERASPLMSVEPVPIPAPTGSVPASPVEPVPVAPVAPVSVIPVEPEPVPSVITPKYNDVMTAVLRSDLQAAKELLDLGWWVDKPSASGITPLMAAVMNRDLPMVQLLLDYGAEPTAKALELARKNKDTATATLLENKGAR